MEEAAVFCIDAGLSVLLRKGLEEAVGVMSCTLVFTVFLSSSQLQSDKRRKHTQTQKNS